MGMSFLSGPAANASELGLTTPISVVTELTARQGSEGSLMERLKRLHGEALQTPGCQLGVVWQSTDNPGSFLLVTHWNDMSSWLKFQGTLQTKGVFKELDPVLAGPLMTRHFSKAGLTLNKAIG